MNRCVAWLILATVVMVGYMLGFVSNETTASALYWSAITLILHFLGTELHEWFERRFA